MVELYNIDIATHEQFARDTQALEAFRRQYHLPPAGERTIAVQTRIIDLIPKHPAIVLLLEVYQKKTWANFAVPRNYYEQRLSSSYVAPSLGSTDKINADILKLRSYIKQQKEKGNQADLNDGEIIAQMLEKGVKETNALVDFVIAKMHQFVPA